MGNDNFMAFSLDIDSKHAALLAGSAVVLGLFALAGALLFGGPESRKISFKSGLVTHLNQPF